MVSLASLVSVFLASLAGVASWVSVVDHVVDLWVDHVVDHEVDHVGDKGGDEVGGKGGNVGGKVGVEVYKVGDEVWFELLKEV